MIAASDTHLTSADPAGVAKFVRFLRGPCREATRVLLLGDLFDFWVTAAQRDEHELAELFSALQELAAVREVGFVEGNRDFAASPVMAALGVRPLADVYLLEQADRRVLFTHGDQLCTRDVGYQVTRRLFRADLTRHLLHLAPDRWALSVGRGARATSKRTTARKDYDLMGLVPERVAALIRAHRADALVCGHVHWGKRYRFEVDGRDRDLVVLSAWEDRGTYAEIVDGQVAFRPFE